MTEVGSALNGDRRGFLALLRDQAVTRIVVEHRGRFARFGAEYVEAALTAQGRALVVVDPAVPEHERTPWINTSAYSLRKALNAAKHEVAPWWQENSKEAYATGCVNLAAALGNRTAGRARMPRFKSKRRARLSCRFTTGSFGLARDRRHVQLPVIGVIRTHESTRKPARKFDAGTARIRSATLSWRRGRWHVSLSVELPDHAPAPRTGGRVVGVDLGISHLATLSTGEQIPNGRRLDRELRRLRRAQRACARRRGPDRHTRQEPSRRWRKARARADRIHALLDRDENAARNLAALAAGTGELRREQPDRTDVRPARLAAVAVGSLRQEPQAQRRHRKVATAGRAHAHAY